MAGQLSAGDFVAIILFIQQLVFPTALLGFTITAYQRGEVSLDRIEAIFERSLRFAMPRGRFLCLKPVGHLQAKGLTFTYPGQKARRWTM